MDGRFRRVDSRRGMCYVQNNLCHIPLNNSREAICDEDYIKEVNKYSWSINNTGYVCTTVYKPKKHTVLLHRLLYGEIKSRLDHINMNKLDNRSCNLRPATNAENVSNANKRCNNSVGYKGVVKVKSGFEVRIGHNYKRYFVGYFKNVQEAARAYDKAAKELHGEFARLNFPNE